MDATTVKMWCSRLVHMAFYDSRFDEKYFDLNSLGYKISCRCFQNKLGNKLR